MRNGFFFFKKKNNNQLKMKLQFGQKKVLMKVFKIMILKKLNM